MDPLPGGFDVSRANLWWRQWLTILLTANLGDSGQLSHPFLAQCAQRAQAAWLAYITLRAVST